MHNRRGRSGEKNVLNRSKLTAAFAAVLIIPMGVSAIRGETGVAEAAVAVAQFTTGIENRQPVDSVSFLENEARAISFFSDLRGLAGHSISHRWQYQGKVMAEVSFEVRGNRWRVWSSKKLISAWSGKWTVSVVGPGGEILATRSFNYNEKL